MIEDDDLSGAGDWTRPGVYRCAPDVYRIPLPLPMDGLRAVNVYAIRHKATGQNRGCHDPRKGVRLVVGVVGLVAASR